MNDHAGKDIKIKLQLHRRSGFISIQGFPKFQTSSNRLLFDFSLTIADIMLILDSVLQKSIVQHFQQPHEWYNKTYPYIWHPLKGISLSATIFMVVSVSAERFRAVCHPMSRKHVSTFIC